MIDRLLQCTFATLKGKYTQNVIFEEVFQEKTTDGDEVKIEYDTSDDVKSETSSSSDFDDIIFTSTTPDLEPLSDLQNITLQRPEQDLQQITDIPDLESLSGDDSSNEIEDIEKMIVKPPSMTNTCCICWGNSILQILFSIVDFRTTVIQNDTTLSCECKNDEFCLFCTVEDCIYEMVLQENEFVDLSELFYNAETLNAYFVVNGFNDGGEFFEILIDKYTEFTNDHFRFDIGSVLRNFKIKIRDQFKCFSCDQDIPMNYPTYDVNFLNLDTTSNEHGSIKDCLESWNEWEPMPDYECKLCFTTQSVLKQSNVTDTNKFCVFHLNTSGTSNISYPIQFKWTEQNKTLRLFAVGCAISQDHWWAYTYVKNNWWKCDDLSIRKTRENVVTNHKNAVILFYEVEATDIEK